GQHAQHDREHQPDGDEDRPRGRRVLGLGVAGRVGAGLLAGIRGAHRRSMTTVTPTQTLRDQPDRTSASRWQGGPEPGQGAPGALWDWAQARRGLRLRTLVLLRWALIAWELAAVLWVQFGAKYDLPLLWCLLAILASAWLNLALTLAWPGSRLAGRREA